MNLRKQLIRLAHENPGEVRDALLPLLREAAIRERTQDPSKIAKLAMKDPRVGPRIKQLAQWMTQAVAERVEGDVGKKFEDYIEDQLFDKGVTIVEAALHYRHYGRLASEAR